MCVCVERAPHGARTLAAAAYALLEVLLGDLRENDIASNMKEQMRESGRE